MRKIVVLLIAVMLIPASLHAQVYVGNTIPKVEFSVGGGAGIGGYVASFPTSPWLNHVGQSDDLLQDYMKFYVPKSILLPSGHAGIYVDFNFTDHWGLITGAEFGLYYGKVKSDNLLNVSSYVCKGIGAQYQEYYREIWVGANPPGFQEQHRMFAAQVPLMVKYMTPVSPLKGHQFYVAAGAKLGIHVLSQYAQKWDSGGKYDVFALRDYPPEGNSGLLIKTFNGAVDEFPNVPATYIYPYYD